MKKAMKRIAVILGGIFLIVIVALLVAPKLVDVQKYKLTIEKIATEVTGRPLTLGDFDISFFPRTGLSVSDIRLGNPEGFQEKDFLSVNSFELKVGLLPLAFGELRVERFVMVRPRIVLEKSKDGKVNWEMLGKEEQKTPSAKGTGNGLPFETITIGEFSIQDGEILFVDHSSGGKRRQLSDVALRLDTVSLESPIHLTLSAKMDNRPISLEGDVGPLGKDPGKGNVPVDLVFKALGELVFRLKGEIIEPGRNKQFSMSVEVPPFSPRRLWAAMGESFPFSAADPAVLNRVALKLNLKGGPEYVTISDGAMELDESKLDFSISATDYAKPDIAFDINLDSLDLDRYLTRPVSEKKVAEGSEEPKKKEQKEPDLTALRNLLLDGALRVGEFKAHGLKIEDLNLKISGKGGLFKLELLALRLYSGRVSSSGAFDVRRNVARGDLKLDADGVQIGPLLQDSLEKDFLEGTLKSQLNIKWTGVRQERIKRTITGVGDLLLNDGAIVGINLAGMVRNMKAAFGLAVKESDKPRTDFAELHVPFTLSKGLLRAPKTTLNSPLLRVRASGKADLIKEELDFHIEPKFVATFKGQGDRSARSGFRVPVLVTGSFSSPKFRPDLKGLLMQGFKGKTIPGPSDLLQETGPKKDLSTGLKEKAKSILRGLPFGN